ncbi:ATP-dependent DNA helicase PIF1 [Ceratobasidium sp. AG-Ba]|nr:ATP-dependent DNA helicase PIF1 [Ceratobasidium sp. AG-Ba]
MQQVNLPRSIDHWEQYNPQNPLIMEQLQLQNDQPPDAAELHHNQLNNEQLAAFDNIYHSVVEDQGCTFFLDGPAGTGKTFLYKALCYQLRSEGKIVLCVASSGIAALLLPGGRTSHSRFKIPVENLTEASNCNISKTSDLAGLIRQTSLIIWDEVPVQHKHCAEAFDRTARDICDKQEQPVALCKLDMSKFDMVMLKFTIFDFWPSPFDMFLIFFNNKLTFGTSTFDIIHVDPVFGMFQDLHILSYRPMFAGKSKGISGY